MAKHRRRYRSKTFCDYLRLLEVTQSYLKTGVPYGNSAMEPFFTSLKREEWIQTPAKKETAYWRSHESSPA